MEIERKSLKTKKKICLRIMGKLSLIFERNTGENRSMNLFIEFRFIKKIVKKVKLLYIQSIFYLF